MTKMLLPFGFSFVYGALIQTGELFSLRWFAEIAFFVSCWLTAQYIGETSVEYDD